MTESVGTFPFGQPVRQVVQEDRSPKRLFVLGAYASAVHARWVGLDGKTIVMALGVASEPCIFWQGDSAAEIIGKIDVPTEVGRLVPAAPRLNGPSGRSLDDHFLGPLGASREEVWLCDLVPHSCMNPSQRDAVKGRYAPKAIQHGLPASNWPIVPKVLADDTRRREIVAELNQSQAEILVTLGDPPLKWFGKTLGTRGSVRAYGTGTNYGALHDIEVDGRSLKHLPLVHPRQAAGLGRHTAEWGELHGTWGRESAPELLR